jgi:hypothetical protein
VSTEIEAVCTSTQTVTLNAMPFLLLPPPPPLLLLLFQVSEAMSGKDKVISVTPSTAMSEAAHLMLHHDVSGTNSTCNFCSSSAASGHLLSRETAAHTCRCNVLLCY